jgi:hypothetical protein
MLLQFKVGKSRLNDATHDAAAEQSPAEELESEALNNNAAQPRDAAMATVCAAICGSSPCTLQALSERALPTSPSTCLTAVHGGLTSWPAF